MIDRQFLWGLSGGVSIFTIAGAFWFGLGFSSLFTAKTEWWVWSLSTVLQVGVSAGLLWAAIRLRRRSGFTTADLRRGDERLRAESRRIRTGFAWIAAGQTVLIAVGVWWCVRSNATNGIWPWIGFVVSLHFAPMARLFHVRAYYVTALAGTIISLMAFIGMMGTYTLPGLGSGLAAVMWLTATYLVWNAEKIAIEALREPWAV
jgi:hypothetical protein